ncbi:hypothetical protein [Paenibacillus sp. CR_12]|uniref:hypothetical protein n=1 Tax=Paenibacillus sp. CR_12 TaxID=3055793 RepID=UPI0035C0987D
MANWLSIINLQGMYTSPAQSLPLIADGVLSKISWEMEQPLESQIVVQTRVSKNGYEWSEWRNCLNGGQVPDLNEDSHLNNAKFMFRVLIRSTSYHIIPKFKHITFEFEPVLVFDNKGDLHCKPEIWITKKENGDFSIQNLTHNLDEFKFTDLIHDETIYVNNETEDIETSLPVTYRYSNFNDHYLSFPLGKNILRIKGKADIRLRYQFKMI